jgi:hypothetical protein
MNDKTKDYKNGDNIFVFDDGKHSRPSEGKIIHIINEDKIVVEFKPWGYEDSLSSTLVFQKCLGGYYAWINEINESDGTQLELPCADYCAIHDNFTPIYNGSYKKEIVKL